MSFNNYLRRKLQETNISQTQLANDIHSTKATISRWIKPYSSNPHEESMKKVIEYFGDSYKEIHKIFLAEEMWGEYFWKNFRGLLLEKNLCWFDVPDVDEDVISRYYAGKCEYVELEDIKKIAEFLKCSVDRLVDNSTITDCGYNNIGLIGPEESRRTQLGLSINFIADYKVGTTEMEPLIHYGDQISLKKDYITGELIKSPKKGDIVVLKDNSDILSEWKLATGKKLFIRRTNYINENVIYEADNAQFPPIVASENIEVVGIVAQSITQF